MSHLYGKVFGSLYEGSMLGAGVHVCVGSRLAEMQLRLAFAEMARHVRRIEIMGEPVRVRSNFINGFKRLDVRLVA